MNLSRLITFLVLFTLINGNSASARGAGAATPAVVPAGPKSPATAPGQLKKKDEPAKDRDRDRRNDPKPPEPNLPVVSVTAVDEEAYEGGPTSGAFKLSRTGSTANELSVNLDFSGSARPGRDYEALRSSIAFARGKASVLLVVTPINDDAREERETVEISIRSGEGYLVHGHHHDTISIIDDDDEVEAPNEPPQVELVAPREGAIFEAPATIELRAEASDRDGEVRLVEFFANDRLIGSDSTAPFTAVWREPAVGAAILSARAIDNRGASAHSRPVKVEVRHAAAERPEIRIEVKDAEAVEAPGPDRPANPAMVTLTRTGSTVLPLKVFYTLSGTAENGVDYVRLDGDATIQGGLRTRDLLVQPLSDRAIEGKETVMFKLKPDDTYRVGTPESANVTIRDPETPPNPEPTVVTIRAVDNEARESGTADGGDTAAFSVSRTGSRDTRLFVKYLVRGTGSNGIDYVKLPGEVMIPAHESSALIQVTPLDDRQAEETETVDILLPQIVYIVDPGPEHSYLVGVPSNAVVRISDNDAAPSNRPPSVQLISPAQGASYSAGAAIFLLASATDGDGSVRTIEFFAGSQSLGKTTNNPVSLIPIIPFRFLWMNVPSGSHDLTAKATDNLGASTVSERVRITVGESTEQPVVTIAPSDAEAREGAAVNAAVNTGSFKLSRTGSSDFELPVYLAISGTAANGTDYNRIMETVPIPAGKSSVEIIVRPLNDELREETETVIITVQPPVCPAIFPPPRTCYRVGDAHTARIIIIDNEAPNTAPPSIIRHPESKTVPSGSRVSLEVTATGSSPLSYQWRFNGNAVAGANTTTLLRPAITTEQAGEYAVVVANTAGSVTSRVAVVSVGNGAVSLNNFDSQQAVRLANGSLAPIVGTSVQVWGAAPGQPLRPIIPAIGGSTLRLSEPGFFDGGFGIVPRVAANGEAQFMVVAWREGDSFETARIRGRTAVFTQSAGSIPPLPGIPNPAQLRIPGPIVWEGTAAEAVAGANANIISVSRLLSGDYELVVEASRSTQVRVETTSDLSHWEPLAELSVAAGITRVTDHLVAGASQRFYRLIALSPDQ